MSFIFAKSNVGWTCFDVIEKTLSQDGSKGKRHKSKRYNLDNQI